MSAGAVAHAAEQHLVAEAAVFVHFEHVDGNVRRREALDPIERLAPTGFGLPGETGDEVDVVVRDAGVAQQCGSSATIVSAVCLRPVRRISASTNDCTPEAHAIDSGLRPGARLLSA